MATAEARDVAHDVKPKGTGQLRCVVVTPERTLLDNLVRYISLPLYDGELGVLPGRAPLIGRLGYGELRTVTDGVTHRYFVDGGFAQVRDDVVTVLTSRAIPAEEIDAAAAARELEQALERRSSNEAEQMEKDRAVARARGQVHVASRKG
jgi:F-type H+-transporting ATPase subunit epsilon